MVQYQPIKDCRLADTAHSLAHISACLFSTEENGCGISKFYFVQLLSYAALTRVPSVNAHAQYYNEVDAPSMLLQQYRRDVHRCFASQG